MFLHQFFVKGLGHASYLVGDPDAGIAAVIDPRRDVDAYLDLARDEGLRIAEIFETHVHNDYVSGADELRRATDATVRASAVAGLTRPHEALAGGDEVLVGSLRFRAVATPGHTPEHLSFLVADLSRTDEDWILFSGGALLVGTAARPDLLGGAEEARRGAEALYRTLQDRIAPMPDWIELYPTHGAGSLCGSGIGGKRWSTIGFERRHNPALGQPDLDAFTRFILADQPSVPAHWRQMRPINQAGATPMADLAEPRPMTADEVAHAAGHGATILDIRDPDLFAAGHVPGALSVGLGDTFGTWAGAVAPIDRELILVAGNSEEVRRAIPPLRRSGFDRILGWLQGGMDAWTGATATLDRVRPAELVASRATVLDVREIDEWRDGHVPDAVHLPGAQLSRRLEEVPDGPVLVICGSGYRSTIAASLLAAAGREDIAHVIGGMDAYRSAGLPVAHERETGEPMSFPFGPKVDEIDVKDTADGLANEPGAVLIDVREPDEWRAGHARGARHIPLAQLPASLAQLPREAPVYLICATGNRSGKAAAFLQQNGFSRPLNVRGGTVAWQRAGLPIDR